MSERDETREAVARAIYESRNGRGCVPWARQPDSHKQPYRADADAALAALQALAVKRAEEFEVWFDSLPREPNDALRKLFADYKGAAMLRACEEKGDG